MYSLFFQHFVVWIFTELNLDTLLIDISLFTFPFYFIFFSCCFLPPGLHFFLKSKITLCDEIKFTFSATTYIAVNRDFGGEKNIKNRITLAFIYLQINFSLL